MRKYLLIAVLAVMNFSVKAQDELLENRIVQTKRDTKILKIQSLEGKALTVKLLPDYVHDILCVIYLKDTIKVFDYWGVRPETSYLSKRFLKINYEVRGGSNFGLGNSLIICVSNNKLYEALHILRYTDWESELIKKYDVKLALITLNKNYVINASIRDKSISTNNPETDYYYTNNSKLHFDKKLKVFYSIKKNLSDTLKVIYANTTYKREIEGNFPEVILEDNKYVFIGGQWFELDKDAIVKY